jgi:hypothetical protein
MIRACQTGLDRITNWITHHNPEKLRRFYLIYGAFLIAGLVAIFWDMIISGKHMVALDLVHHGYFFRQFLRDQLLTTGSVPGWNPHLLCGLPFIAAIHGGAFYPLQWIDLLSTNLKLAEYNLILHFFLAGLFTYFTARQLNCGKLASALAGVTYGLSPCLVSWVAPGHDGKIYVAALLPLVVLFLIRTFENRKLLDATLLGIVLGTTILTGHLQMAYYVFWAVGFYVAWRLAELIWKRRRLKELLRPALLTTLAVGLALGIGSIQLLPSYKYLITYSVRADNPQDEAFATAFSVRSEELISHVVPEFCGHNNIVTREKQYWGKNSFKDNSESVGLVPLLLALMGLAVPGRKGKSVWVGLAIAALIYSLGCTTPVFTWLLKIIPLSYFMRAPASISFIFCFCIALLAGLGVQSIIQTSWKDLSTRCKRTLRLIMRGVPVLLLGLALLFNVAGNSCLKLYTSFLHPQISSAKWQYALNNQPYIEVGIWLAFLFSVAATLVVRRTLSSKHARHVWVLSLIGLVAVAHINFDRGFVQLVDRPPQVIDSDTGRFLGDRESLDRAVPIATGSNVGHWAPYGVYSTLGISSRFLYWYSDLVGGDDCRAFLNPRFANLSGTRYLVHLEGVTIPLDILGPVPLDTLATLDNRVILENHNCYPRAYLVGAYQKGNDAKTIGQWVREGQDDLRELVYLEEDPDLTIQPDTSGVSSAHVRYYSPDSIAIDIHTPTNQLLVLTDNYYPDWHAFVDGQPYKIHRAYGSFRAVEVPAETSEVVFVFDSPAYNTGCAVSAVSLILSVGLLALCWFKPSRTLSVKKLPSGRHHLP